MTTCAVKCGMKWFIYSQTSAGPSLLIEDWEWISNSPKLYGRYSHFLHDRPWISPWIKSISNELDIDIHVIASQLSGHCDIIGNRWWRHQENENWVSEPRERWVKIVVLSSFMESFCRVRKKLPNYQHIVYTLTRWGRLTHICVSKLTIICSDNGLLPGRRQAIIWTNAGILLIWTLGTNFSDILSENQIFSFKKMHLKMSSAKSYHRPQCVKHVIFKVTQTAGVFILSLGIRWHHSRRNIAEVHRPSGGKPYQLWNVSHHIQLHCYSFR